MIIPTYFLSKEFSEDTGVELIDSEENEVLLLLEKVVEIYLSRHFEKLLSIMYRIDINEQHFSVALTTDKPSYAIAILVIEREKQRVLIRERYKKKDNN